MIDAKEANQLSTKNGSTMICEIILIDPEYEQPNFFLKLHQIIINKMMSHCN